MIEDVNTSSLVSEYVSKFVTCFCKVTEQTDLLGKFTTIIHAGCELSLYKTATTVFSHPSNKNIKGWLSDRIWSPPNLKL